MCVCVRMWLCLAMCATLALAATFTATDKDLISTDKDSCLQQCLLKLCYFAEQLSPCDNLACEDVCSQRLRSRRRRRSLRAQGLREAQLIARSVGLEVPSKLGDTSIAYKAGPVRNLRVVSQREGGEVVVAWDSRGLWSLVSWEVEGGVLRGNLLTNTSSAALSLLPDTLYRIQVTGSGSQEPSGCLEVDTHTAPSSRRVVPHSLTRVGESASLAAALCVFLLSCALLYTRWRLNSSFGASKGSTIDYFKVFPPPVTIHVVTVSKPHPHAGAPELLV